MTKREIGYGYSIELRFHNLSRIIKGAVADGTFLGAITQAPVAMGEKLVELLVAAANGESVADTDTGCQWYTAENMDSEEIAQNLYD